MDATTKRRTNDTLRALGGEERVFELPPNFEVVVVLHDRRHRSEQAWRHFRDLPESAVPTELRCIVDAAVALLANPAKGARR